MLLLKIVIYIIGGSIIFYFCQVLITVTRSSLCSYGTVLRIRDVPFVGVNSIHSYHIFTTVVR